MSYTVILNSNLRTSGTVSDARYMFDWTALPQGKYKVSWSFVSGPVDLTVVGTPFDLMLIEAQLGQSSIFRPTAAGTTRAEITMCIGTIVNIICSQTHDEFTMRYNDVNRIYLR